jgi:hypothetical protein
LIIHTGGCLGCTCLEALLAVCSCSQSIFACINVALASTCFYLLLLAGTMKAASVWLHVLDCIHINTSTPCTLGLSVRRALIAHSCLIMCYAYECL